MQAQILSIGTALPSHEHRQEEVGNQIAIRLGLSEILGSKLRKIYQQSAIHIRHTVMEDLFGSELKHFFCEEKVPKMRERNELYK